MSAMKEYALGVCYAHQKEMFHLYDLLWNCKHAEAAVSLAGVEIEDRDISPLSSLYRTVRTIDAILENIPNEESEVMLNMVNWIADDSAQMKEERDSWRDTLIEHPRIVCTAHSREMYALLEQLHSCKHAKTIISMELIELSGGDTYPSDDIQPSMSKVGDILSDIIISGPESLYEEDAVIMLDYIFRLLDNPVSVEDELAYWKGRCAA